MAESQSMTSAGVVAKALIDEHADFLRESVAMVAREIMEAEISRQIGAGKGEVAEARSTHRNGYQQRSWATRVGEIELAVPRKRSGESYFPSFLEPPPGRRAAVEQPSVPLHPPAAQPLARRPLADAGGLGRRRQRPALLFDAPDQELATVRAGASVSVELHPVSSLNLGGSAPPAFKEARMNNVVRNYT